MISEKGNNFERIPTCKEKTVKIFIQAGRRCGKDYLTLLVVLKDLLQKFKRKRTTMNTLLGDEEKMVVKDGVVYIMREL